ncbi:TlpA disulfide reductase family protein [Ancylobacter terrae]|uniref:TlpA disulfide reductase family protein n=1 Tax=Ancylobacter sp. sgz301288 TaxID=3342077 RepID=UPI00385D0F28
MLHITAPAWRGRSLRLALPVAALLGAAGAGACLGAPAAAAEEFAPQLRPWTRGPAPALALDRLGGGRTDLAGARGSVVLVHFFATWCEPCRAEMASLRRLAADPPVPGLAILAVDVGEVDARVARFFEAEPLPFPILMDRDRAATRAWGIVALPSTVVLDADLIPRLIVEADLDWDSPDVRRTLATLAGPVPARAD